MNFRLSILLFSACLFSFSLPAQWINKDSLYAIKKGIPYVSSPGSLIKQNQVVPAALKISPNPPSPQGVTNCDCWQERDSTFSVVPFQDVLGSAVPPDYRNDDGSTNIINLPFSFCFYGNNTSQLYINNNGNISFGTSYSQFTANPFPDPTYSMIAPFWGDVDTRGTGSGIVYYKMTATHLIIQWDGVGYYNSHADKKNTFQLIMTNGSDPLIPDGNNVSFCYKDMQWTTGDVDGANGFGGTPSTVGANKGDGTSYIQFGRFDQAGSAYDGAFGNPDGVSWLDNQSFVFNSCNVNNIAPVVTDFSLCEADTVQVCENDTLIITVKFQSPEVNQVTTASVSAPGVNNFSTLSNTSGNTAEIEVMLIGSQNNLGDNMVTFSGTDNGTPVQTTTFSIVFHVDSLPDAIAGPDTALCNGPVALNASGGVSYSWYPPTGLSDPNIPDPMANPTVQTEYVLTVSNGICTATDTLVVSLVVAANAGPDTFICAGDSIPLNATGGISYTWNPPAGLSNDTIPNPSASPDSLTNYAVLVIDGNGCINSDTVKIAVEIVPAAFAGNDTAICFGDTIQLNASGGLSYHWSPAAGLNNPDTANPVAAPIDTTQYILTVSNGKCDDDDTLNLIVNPIPVANAGNDVEICYGQDTLLTATGGAVYSWQPPMGLSNPDTASPTASPSVTTAYVVNVSNDQCADKDTIVVTVHPLPAVNAGLDVEICRNESTFLTGSGNGLPSWYPAKGINDTADFSTLASPGSTITYYFSITDSNNCVNTDSVNVVVWDLPTANAGADVIIVPGTPTTLNASGGFSYLWSTGESAPSITVAPALITGYIVTVTDTNGCTDADTVMVEIKPQISLPTIFSPNDDGINDVIRVHGFGVHEYKLVIYDRWGIKIFKDEGSLLKSGGGGGSWDGTRNGEKLNAAVYVYILDAVFIDGGKFHEQGNITLVR